MDERPVEREDHADGACGSGPFHPSDHRVAVAGPVDLEQRLGIGADHVVHRHRRERAEAHHHAPGGRGSGDSDLAVRVHRLDACRADHHRHRHRLAHHLGRHLARGRLASGQRSQPDLVEGRAVVVAGDAAFGPGDQRAVHGFRQAPFGALLGDRDRLEPRVEPRILHLVRVRLAPMAVTFVARRSRPHRGHGSAASTRAG